MNARRRVETPPPVPSPPPEESLDNALATAEQLLAPASRSQGEGSRTWKSQLDDREMSMLRSEKLRLQVSLQRAMVEVTRASEASMSPPNRLRRRRPV